MPTWRTIHATKQRLLTASTTRIAHLSSSRLTLGVTRGGRSNFVDAGTATTVVSGQ
jgi:hypothetical protein